jgi:hypothetical protein
LHDTSRAFLSLDRKSVRLILPRMTTSSYTEARDNLASLWDRTVSTREPVNLMNQP